MTAAFAMLALNNGIGMPALGLGVYRSGPQETLSAVSTALAIGYRLLDTAAAYRNEAQVGEAICRSGIDRRDLFVTTKLWISDYGYDTALRGFERSMRKLGLDTADLYLLHQPMPNEWDRTVAAWKAVGRLLAEGRARAIGVSNFSSGQLADLIDRTGVVPLVNQVELIPSSRKPSCAQRTSGWVSSRKHGRRSEVSCATSATTLRLRKARFRTRSSLD